MGFHDKDRLYRYLAKEHGFRLSVVQTSHLVAEAIERHNPNPFGALLLGEALTAAVLASSLLKEAEVISLVINAHTPENKRLLVAEAGKTGEVRGYLAKDPGLPRGKDRAEALESYLKGSVLQVTKWLKRRPQDSFTEMQHGHIGADLTEYYLRSEQILTEIRIDIHFSEDLSLQSAHGLLVQALPDRTKDSEDAMRQALLTLPPLHEVAAHLSHSEKIATRLFRGLSLTELDRYPVHFFCRCSKPGFLRSLASLPKADLEDLAWEGTQEIVCDYCTRRYFFTPDELRNLIRK